MVGGEQIKERAEMIAKELKITDCKFSDGWFSRFKARHNLKFKTSHGEAKSADSDAADKWVKDLVNLCGFFHALSVRFLNQNYCHILNI